MSGTLAPEPKGVFDSRSSRGVGEESTTLGRVMSEVQRRLLASFSIGNPKRDALEALDDTFEESCQPGWDGYSGAAVPWETYLRAKEFLHRFPTSLRTPEVSVDPDGEISFEWYVAPNRVLLVSVGSDGDLTYAGVFGASGKKHGTEAFYDEIPKEILESVKRIGEQIAPNGP